MNLILTNYSYIKLILIIFTLLGKAKCTEESVGPQVIKALTGVLEGDTVTFSCSTGYQLSSDNRVVTCTSTGQWSAPWSGCQGN